MADHRQGGETFDQPIQFLAVHRGGRQRGLDLDLILAESMDFKIARRVVALFKHLLQKGQDSAFAERPTWPVTSAADIASKRGAQAVIATGCEAPVRVL